MQSRIRKAAKNVFGTWRHPQFIRLSAMSALYAWFADLEKAKKVSIEIAAMDDTKHPRLW
jgi:hypothetical protein